MKNGGRTVEVIGRIAENVKFGIRNAELGSANKIQKLGKVVLDGDNSHLKFIANDDIINNSEQETDSNLKLSRRQARAKHLHRRGDRLKQRQVGRRMIFIH